MKVMILAGGFGSRISEESTIRPKPMVEIGNMPILWHIMKIYSQHGLNDFIICCGYKSEYIKEWFTHYRYRHADVTFDFRKDAVEVQANGVEPWRVTLVETGANTMTGGRIKRASRYLDDEPFCLTYGDGVGNIDIQKAIQFHKCHGKLVTMTAVRPEARFGVFRLDDNDLSVDSFKEKPREANYINGGYFVIEPKAVDYIEGDETSWELGPMERIAQDGQLMANRHDGFWMAMDTLRDKIVLEKMWGEGNAPWKIW
ncbi:MAG: glucose-1-phosphate cytidylyltransferase [Pseudomonadales bacterium]